MASIAGSREAERQARLDLNQKILDDHAAEDRRFMSRQGFWSRFFLRRHRARVELFAKQLLIKACERGILTSQQTRSVIASAERMLRPEDRR
jgi:hypothetical protein